MNDELTALVFELQRVPSAADKAKVLARAWRTVRGLKSAERRLLAREVGFDGAEELIEGLGGKERGVFAPAAVLEALGKLRADPALSVRGILADLRDPDRRDDLLVRGMDLVAQSVSPEPEIDIERYELPDGHVWMRQEDASAQHDRALDLEEEAVGAVKTEDGGGGRQKAKPPRPPVPDSPPKPKPEPRQEPKTQPRHRQEPSAKPVPKPKPEPKQQPEPKGEPPAVPKPKSNPEVQIHPEPEPSSPWDSLGARDEKVVPSMAVAAPSLMEMLPTDHSQGSDEEVEGSAIERLRDLRNEIRVLGSAGTREIAKRLDSFPESWARRRALVALIEAGVPDEPARVLDLIESLPRPLDRRWCLSALARRGDLTGDDLDRALALLSSPAARRRVAGLAAR